MSKIKAFFAGKGNKKIFEYIFFVVVSLLFWFILTQSEVVQGDFNIPVEIKNVPENISINDKSDNSITVSLKGTGFSLFKYRIGTLDPIILDYEKHSRNSNVIVRKTEMDILIRNYFGKGKTIISISPDSICFKSSVINQCDSI